MTESFRVSRRGGRLAIVLDTVRNFEDDRHYMLPVVSDMTQLAIDCGWRYMNDIAWLKGEISGSKKNFGSLGLCSAPVINRNHETILLFYREPFKLDGDRTLCDLSTKEYFEWWTSAWDIKPELDKTIRDHHPTPFPEEIPHRLIKFFTYGRDLVVDPFNGSGTTTAVANRLGRRFIGIDQSATYCAFGRTRLVQSLPKIATPSPLPTDEEA